MYFYALVSFESTEGRSKGKIKDFLDENSKALLQESTDCFPEENNRERSRRCVSRWRARRNEDHDIAGTVVISNN